ncbi:MAG TPA: nicotinamide riboside transporter PnuC [Bacteroidales bacterium]|nr:nicotinamide riboside transporter PnuC [Bacteroidales bacterium]
MEISRWLMSNYIEVFGAVTGIVYVLLEIRQNIWLWPLGIITSAVYIWVFFVNKFYADMSLQCYYLIISVLGWYWWTRKSMKDADEDQRSLYVSRIKLRTGILVFSVFILLYFLIWFVLQRFTDSPVPEWDSFITSLSIVATWMLARKIYEHWYLWIVVNSASALIFFTRELYPTMILYFVYGVMSLVGMREWKKTIRT